LFFSLRIKLLDLIRLIVSPSSFDTGAQNGVLLWVSTKPLITEEIWPGRGKAAKIFYLKIYDTYAIFFRKAGAGQNQLNLLLAAVALVSLAIRCP
jgi:hypothetical protein